MKLDFPLNKRRSLSFYSSMSVVSGMKIGLEFVCWTIYLCNAFGVCFAWKSSHCWLCQSGVNFQFHCWFDKQNSENGAQSNVFAIGRIYFFQPLMVFEYAIQVFFFFFIFNSPHFLFIKNILSRKKLLYVFFLRTIYEMERNVEYTFDSNSKSEKMWILNWIRIP